MPRQSLLALLLTGLVLTACHKPEADPATAPRCAEYGPGDVAVGINPTVEIGAVFTQLNALGLHVSQTSGFGYVSGLPADSLAYVRRTLRAKPYLTARGFTVTDYNVYAVGLKIYVTTSLFDLTPANQADWLQTLQLLKLTDEAGARCQSCKTVLLKVPVGTEQRWVQELAKAPAVRWAELNCYRQIILH